MKAIQNQMLIVILALSLGLTFQCASPKVIATRSFEESTPFQIKSVYFQEWYAGIDYGGTGYTLYLPVVKKEPNVDVEEVYFRNLLGRLQLQDGRYIAVLKSPNKNYVFGKPPKPENYPFNIKDNECVISYTINGERKYHKAEIDKELAGAYYKNGVPSIYTRTDRTILATLDEGQE